jgi:hypothetical protein
MAKKKKEKATVKKINKIVIFFISFFLVLILLIICRWKTPKEQEESSFHKQEAQEPTYTEEHQNQISDLEKRYDEFEDPSKQQILNLFKKYETANEDGQVVLNNLYGQKTLESKLKLFQRCSEILSKHPRVRAILSPTFCEDYYFELEWHYFEPSFLSQLNDKELEDINTIFKLVMQLLSVDVESTQWKKAFDDYCEFYYSTGRLTSTREELEKRFRGY